jgi:squalene-associated FAD-dependent desaturase
VENLGHRVAIVGGGYAGMAAAATLASAGARVTVLEAAAVVGGRARRVQAHGRELDNGQHILLGAYRELLRLMRLVGVPADAVLRVPLELRYADGFVLRPLWLPAPFGMLGGLLAARKVPMSERIGAVRFVLWLKRAAFRVDPRLSVSHLLDAHRQSGPIGEYLWRPLCIAALNTPPDQASAQVFVNVLRDSLAGADGASDLLLPRVDLSQLFPERAAEFVRSHGGEVRTGCTVQALEPGPRVDGDAYSHVIVAVGPHQLKRFAGVFAGVPAYRYQPIYTCYLQYPPRTRLPFPMLGLSDGLSQWVFDRGALGGSPGLLACVISAQGAHQKMSHAELAAACHEQLARSFRLPPPQWTQVIAEKRATPACVPGFARPPQTAIAGLYVAGDYMDPEYPPVLEAAVRSGVRAAGAILQ